MKKVAIITYDEQDSRLFSGQLSSLFSGLVSVEAFHSLNQNNARWPVADLYLIGNSALPDDADIEKLIPFGADYVMANSTFTKKAIERLKKVPPGVDALFVSCNETLCNEAITRLRSLGVQHINFIPYYPGLQYTGNLVYAITPGESRYVPEAIQFMIDVGGRQLDANTIAETAVKLKLDHILGQGMLKAYFEQLADNTYSFDKLFERRAQSENRMAILLDILSEGIIGVDEHGICFAYNEEAEKILGISKNQVLGRDAEKVLSFLPFGKYQNARSDSEPALIKFKGIWLNVTIQPILYGGKNKGVFASIVRFKDVETKQNMLRRQLYEDNKCAKYTFDDIIYRSAQMGQSCDIARRMSQTNSSILITGESGTGKELFAHSIHNASPRRQRPFVAINCAALPENLLESELFGYEEGAFTGAKKGGKIGLFEFAHSGSIFLDEVEGMSPALQIKLLRVLQEKEIMHIGGHGTIRVDVRIIATSNERLDIMVEEGRFRSDLYYRLNTLPIYLPPLRERTEDIPELVNHFMAGYDRPFRLSDQVLSVFLSYPWKGNVRELHNCMEYLHFLGKDVISLADLPPSFHKFTSLQPPPPAAAGSLKTNSGQLTKEAYLFVLSCLLNAENQGRRIGRETILELAHSDGYALSQANVRLILSELSRLGLVTVNIGRRGSQITPQGIQALNNRLAGY